MNEPTASFDGEEVQTWLEAARSGDAAALNRLMANCRDYLLLVANQEFDAALQGKLNPSDLVQETLLNAQQKFGDFRGAGEQQLLAWMRRILLNQLADARRKFRLAGKRQVSRERPLDLGDAAQIELTAPDRTPRSATIAAEEAERLKQALDRLPEHYREVVMLRNWERLPFATIGERLGRSTDAVEKLWVRAIERLRQELDDSRGAEEP